MLTRIKIFPDSNYKQDDIYRNKNCSACLQKNSRTSSLFSMTFHDFSWLSMTFAVFHDFPGLENGLTKFHDFPGRVVTLFSSSRSVRARLLHLLLQYSTRCYHLDSNLANLSAPLRWDKFWSFFLWQLSGSTCVMSISSFTRQCKDIIQMKSKIKPGPWDVNATL